jgi:hypothetical protein
MITTWPTNITARADRRSKRHLKVADTATLVALYSAVYGKFARALHDTDVELALNWI